MVLTFLVSETAFLLLSGYFLQEHDFPTETVKFGPERMYIDCWVKKQTYDTFKEILGSGMQYHLQVNGELKLLYIVSRFWVS